MQKSNLPLDPQLADPTQQPSEVFQLTSKYVLNIAYLHTLHAPANHLYKNDAENTIIGIREISSLIQLNCLSIDSSDERLRSVEELRKFFPHLPSLNNPDTRLKLFLEIMDNRNVLTKYAKAAGKRRGFKPDVIQAFKTGVKPADIARHLKISRAVVSQHLKSEGLI